MIRADYERALCSQTAGAEVPEFRKVFLTGWIPEISSCHKNVDHWVSAHTGQTAVRGWVFYMPYAFETGECGKVYTAHSVVRDCDGSLYDITPLGDERVRSSLRFVPHLGPEAEFWELEQSNRCIYCPGELELAMDEEIIMAGEEDLLFPDGD